MSKVAFTLVELLLVVAILLSLTAISVPMFRRTYDSLQLTVVVRDISSVLTFCRQVAVFERKHLQFRIQSEKKRYQVFSENEETKEYKPLARQWGRVFSIPQSLSVDTKTGDIDFFPDGSSSGGLIRVADKDGGINTIVIEKETGLTTLNEKEQ